MPVNPKFKVLFREYAELNNFAFLILTAQKWVKKRFHIDVSKEDYDWIQPQYSQLESPGYILLEQSIFEPIDYFKEKRRCRKCPNVAKIKPEKIESIETIADLWKKKYRRLDDEGRKIQRKVMFILKIPQISSEKATNLKNDIERKFGIKI